MSELNLNFPTTKEYTKEDVKKVQNRLLEMADTILPILEKNNIDYMIGYGTLLGAIRHKGFIPWDDDFDIIIFGDQYEKALDILRKELPNDMLVHDKETDPKFWPYWSRVRDLNSETYAKLHPRDNHFKYRGLSFDLFRMDKIPRKDASKTKFKKMLIYQDELYKSNLITLKEKFSTKFKLLPKYLYSCVQSLISRDTKLVYWFLLGYTQGIDENLIFPLKKYEFEGRNFYGPNNPDEILSIKYGDYMRIPDYNHRIQHYSKVIFNTNKNKEPHE